MTVAVYLERGSTRTFACAVDWPGWCRSARGDEAALEALVACAPRFAKALRGTRLGFVPPKSVRDLKVVHRETGDATTDFGAPGGTPPFDLRPLDEEGLRRARAILRASWRTFDAAAAAARGKALAKGPRGGGRDLEAIARHCIEADRGYLGALGWKSAPEEGTLARRSEAVHREMLDGLAAAARGEIPARGPRGGVRWKPRKLVRRSAWHWLDHAWEIEDRSAVRHVR